MISRNDFNYGLQIEGTYSITQESGALYINSEMIGSGLTFSTNILEAIVSGIYQEVTITDINTILVPGDLLIPGMLYKIDTEQTTYMDNGIFLRAISTNQLEKIGTRLFIAPRTYQTTVDGFGNNWLGVWQSTLTPSAGDLVIWGGLVWSNDNGLVGAAVDYTTLDSEWTLIPKDTFSNGEYIELQMNIMFDYKNNWVERQWDSNGNIVGVLYSINNSIGFTTNNPCDITDWNLTSLSLSDLAFWNNDCPFGIYNNVISDTTINNNKSLAIINNISPDIFGNQLISVESNGYIISNTTTGGIIRNEINGIIYQNDITGSIDSNTNIGDISNNTTSSISYNRNGGSIFSNTNSGLIEFNSNSDDIATNSNGGAIIYNSNLGVIESNSNNGDISNNLNGGNITNNSNDGPIVNNSNGTDIDSNSHIGGINFNSNRLFISNNSGNGSIFRNSNLSEIDGNSCGEISENCNLGAINNNSNIDNINTNSNNGNISNNDNNISFISYNKNNGYISNNTGTGGPWAIEYNTNNGYISTTATANISDAIVNK